MKAPVSSTITAVIDALRTMGTKKMVFGTPFEEWFNQSLKSFLEGSGFEVAGMEGMGIKRNADTALLPDHTAYRLAKKVYSEANTKADTVFLHCPEWPTIDYIELLERELGCLDVLSLPLAKPPLGTRST